MTTRAYLRISTAEQDHDSQRQALAGEDIDIWYEDTMSGKTTSRPALDRLLAEVQTGDTIVVFKLDRLGRSMLHLVTTVLGLAERGITVRSLSESLDTSTTVGKLILSMYAGLAEMERENIRERTKAGLAAAKARGVKMGNVAALEKHRHRGGETVARRTREAAERVRWCLEPLVAEGMSLAEMARTLNGRDVRAPSGGRWSAKIVRKAVDRLELAA